MPTLLDPVSVIAYDRSRDRVVLTLRDGREIAVADLDPGVVPALIDAVMRVRGEVKRARKPVPPPPPARCGPRPVPGGPNFAGRPDRRCSGRGWDDDCGRRPAG
jgi:hypothetical protein